MAHPDPPINLTRGWPATSLLPTTLLQSAASTALSAPTITSIGLHYGANEGALSVRQAIANFLTTFYRPKPSTSAPIEPVTPDRLVVTGGASQNLGKIMQVFSDPGFTRKVWMVAPTYFFACGIFEDAGFAGRLRAVREDAQGIDLEGFERMLVEDEREGREKGEWSDAPKYKPQRSHSKIYRHILYCVPTFSNPSSLVMTLARRLSLLALARQHDILIISDDVYDTLQWRIEQPQPCADTQDDSWAHSTLLPRLVDLDRFPDDDDDDDDDGTGASGTRFGNAVSNGSFSKIVAPGVRTGWAESTPLFARALSLAGTSKSGGASSNLMAVIVAELFAASDPLNPSASESVLEHRIRETLNPAYSRRFHALWRAIQNTLLPLGCTVPYLDPAHESALHAPRTPDNGSRIFGGYFVWVKLPKGVGATALTEAAKDDFDVLVASGKISEVLGDEEAAGFDGHIRLCFSWEEEERMAEGVARLGRAIGKMKQGGTKVEDAARGAAPDPSM